MPEINDLANKLDALGHPLRLRIIATLETRKEEMYLNEIANTIGVSRALAKIHLKKLEKAGLAKTRIALSEGEAKALRYYKLRDFDIHVNPQILRKEVEKNGQ
jgi:predicted transcriptional regulator